MVGTLVLELAFVAAFWSVWATGHIGGGRRFHDGVTYLICESGVVKAIHARCRFPSFWKLALEGGKYRSVRANMLAANSLRSEKHKYVGSVSTANDLRRALRADG
jgi:hypothetical protein